VNLAATPTRRWAPAAAQPEDRSRTAVDPSGQAGFWRSLGAVALPRLPVQ